MSEHQGKSCKVNFTNTEKQISVELIYTKKDKDVDIRDFFSKIKEISALTKVEVHFKKGQYQLIDRGQEDVLDMVPKVIENFQEFYKDSFGENAFKDDNTDASTPESLPYVNKQKKSKAQATSENYSGHSYDDSPLGPSRVQKEEGTQTESDLGSSGLANRAFTDEDETAAGSQNTDDDSMANVGKSDIKNTGTTHGCKQHNDRKAENKYLNLKPESGEEHTAKETEKSDSYGMKEEKDNKDEEQDNNDESKHHSRSKEAQKNPSTTRNKTPGLDEKQKEKSDSNGEERKKSKYDGTQKNKDGDTNDEGHARESNNEETGIPQRSKNTGTTHGCEQHNDPKAVNKYPNLKPESGEGHVELKGLQMNSNTTNQMTQENDGLHGDEDRKCAVDATLKSLDASKERGENCSADKESP